MVERNGLEAAILKHAAKDKPIFGICGGYQMLCETLKDPHGVEHGGEMRGLGLLKADTSFEQHKTRTRVIGEFMNVDGIFKALNGKHFEGYEIHMGQTTFAENVGIRQNCPDENKSFSVLTENDGSKKSDGMCCGNVYGSYAHGIFDSDEVLFEIADALMSQKGLKYDRNSTFDSKAYKEQQYDILADALRSSLDMKYIYEVIEKGI